MADEGSSGTLVRSNTISICLCPILWPKKGMERDRKERETETDRQTDRHIQRESERERQRDRVRDRETERRVFCSSARM